MTSRYLPKLTTLCAASVLVACAHRRPAEDSSAPAPAAASTGASTARGHEVPACVRHPLSQATPLVETLHGVDVRDPFRWLEDAESAPVRAWVDEQDRFARDRLAASPLREVFRRELRNTRQSPQWTKMPRMRAGRYLYGRLDPDAERESIFEYDPATAKERVVLDLSKVDPPVKYWFPSRDGKRIALLQAVDGGDELTGRVVDTATSTWRTDEVPGFHYGFPEWMKDGSGFYYTWSPTTPTLTAEQKAARSQVRLHRLGTDPARDIVVRSATGVDGTFEIPSVSPDGRWLLMTRILGPSGRTPFLGAVRADGTVRSWASMAPSNARAMYDVVFGKHDMFVVTNEAAPRGRAFHAETRRPTRENWKEIQAQRHEATLIDIAPMGDFVVYAYVYGAETRYEVRRATGELVKTLEAGAGDSMASMSSDPESDEASIGTSSYTRPFSIATLRAPSFEPVPFPPSLQAETGDDYVTEKAYYTSADGTRAPIFLVRARTTPARSRAPLMLYGYGAFGVSILPHYQRDLRVWLDRGGVYAEAVLRGGAEFGSEWHQAGTGKGRKNVYDDFFAASEHLIKEGWTSPDKFLIRGASAGGLLVAVAETERPELYRGVIAEVPLSDMVRYPLGHDSGTLWLDEYGAPSKKDEFEVLYRFSPYHRVRQGTRYPATLILASEKDKRLDPMHSRKLAAALGDAHPCGEVLLRVERDGGHSGASLSSGWMEQKADLYTFAASLVGMTK